MTQQILLKKYCPDGKEHKRIEDVDAGEFLCSRCGIVFEEKTIYDDMHSHTSTLDSHETNHVGQSNKHVGQSTFMKKNMTDHKGKKAKGINKKIFKDINTWDNRIKWRANNGRLLIIVKQTCDLLKLKESIHVEVEKYMKKLVAESVTRGRVTRELLGATIYYVCKQYDVPMTMKEISEAMDIPSKIIYQNLRVINEAYGSVNKVQSMNSYVSKYFTKTSIKPKYEKEVLRLLQKVEKDKLHVGKSPAVVIGGIMKYLVITTGDYNGTHGDIARACDISEVSLRIMCSRIMPTLDMGVE